MTEPEERHDWRQMQQGDQAAYERIYQRHVQQLLNYGLRLHGSLTSVEDAVQELFIELWQYRHSVTEPASARFYLLRSLRNKLGRQYRRDQPFVSGWEEPPEYPFDMEPSSEQRWIELDIAEQQRKRVQSVINALPPRQREILYLRYFNELTYEQICELTGLNYQTVRSHVYLALKTLRAKLDSQAFYALLLALANIFVNFFLVLGYK